MKDTWRTRKEGGKSKKEEHSETKDGKKDTRRPMKDEENQGRKDTMRPGKTLCCEHKENNEGSI